MVLLTFVWKCFQDRNFHGVVVGLYEQSIESWVGLVKKSLQERFSFTDYGDVTEAYTDYAYMDTAKENK